MGEEEAATGNPVLIGKVTLRWSLSIGRSFFPKKSYVIYSRTKRKGKT
jgi:hypothetical protein